MHALLVTVAVVGGVYVIAGFLCMGWYLLVPGPQGGVMPPGCWTVVVFPVHYFLVAALFQAYDWVRNWWYDVPPAD